MTERGEPPLWLVALGLVLAAVTVTLPWTARAVADREPGQLSRAVAVPRVASSQGSATPAAEPYVVAPDVDVSTAPRPRPAPGVPLRLLVPSLHVDAPVIPISAPGGVLLPPGDPQTLGWWSAGARPGAATGGALITGHTVHTGGGAFDDLDTMKPGEVVRVRTPSGTLDYAVSQVTIYRKSTLARDAERIFSQTVPGRLVLITCEDWNGTDYDSNAVVVANRV
jgi:LPXTG-site transpeptidase (sortase) family protein